MRVSQLTDSGLNMVVGRMTAPDDWQVSEQVQWSSFGNYPGMTQLSAVSPDGLRSFQLISTMSYFQTDSIFSSLGENETDPTTYRIHRQYRTAEQFVELFISNLGCTGAQKLGSCSIDSQSLGALQSVAEQHAYQTGYSLVQSLANLGMSANLVGYESTVVDNRYAVTTQSGQTEYIEVFTLVWAYQTSWVVQNSSITVNEIYWCVPFTYIFTAESEQALTSMQNEFLTFVSNSQRLAGVLLPRGAVPRLHREPPGAAAHEPDTGGDGDTEPAHERLQQQLGHERPGHGHVERLYL